MSIQIQLRNKGVIIHAPLATVIEDVNPDQFEAGVEIFPGCVIKGQKSRFGAGTKLGRTGGGYFEDVRTGRDVDLYGGYFSDCIFLDGVIVRGHAEMRGGTLLEEQCEAAHHVGYKMTVMLPFVVSGSLVNFCDALFAGGTSRENHSEIGSCLALYNYTPYGDKFASMFGDVPRGVFLKSPRIFVGGQTQIVSPVTVGFGAIIPAGCAVRKNVPENRMYGETSNAVDKEFDPGMYGAIREKFEVTIQYIANIRCLAHWYRNVRIPISSEDPHLTALNFEAIELLEACVKERIKRLDRVVKRLPASMEKHRAAQAAADSRGDADGSTQHRRRIMEHKALISAWPELRAALQSPPAAPKSEALAAIVGAFFAAKAENGFLTYIDFISDLDPALVEAGQAHLQQYVVAMVP